MKHILSALLLAGLWVPGAGFADKIAFVRNAAVYSINTDGTGITQLTNPAASGALDTGFVRYSPGGSKIMFQRYDVNYNAQVWVMNADGSAQTLVSPAASYSDTYAWTPAGKVALVANFNLTLVNADGSGPVQLTSAPNAAYGVSASATKIAFANSVSGAKYQIHVINPDGSGLTNLSQTPASTDLDPVYSPDGSKIAYTRYVNQYYGWTGDLYVMNADGTNKINLTNSQDAYGASFSPDGQKIAFTRKQGSAIDLYVVNVSGGTPTRLTTGRSIDGIPSWSPDGTKLTFASNYFDVYTINADGSNITNVTQNASAFNTFPAWGPAAAPAVAQVYYIYADQLNTPRAITNEAATTVWKWDNVDPFGNNVPNEDPDGNSQNFVFNLRFPGQYANKETGLHYNYFRDYDPSIGRYIESDPIGLQSGINTYAYANLNPLLYFDDTGQAASLSWCVAGPIACGAGAAVAVGGIIWAMSSQQGKRGRGKSDPVSGLTPVNPGRDCNGKCNPCPPDEMWEAKGDAHGSTSGSHWHWIKWNQRETDCMCFPDRGSGPTPPQGLRPR